MMCTNCCVYARLCLLAASAHVLVPNAFAEGPLPVTFNRNVRPILAAACFGCHGPDEHKREADLRLDLQQGIARAFEAQTPADSEAWRRIHANDETRMPPIDAERQLSAEEISTLRTWTEQGARWERHWAFIAPRTPVLPAAKQPDAYQTLHPIDQLIDQRLRSVGWQRSPEAERARLIRRVTFDLTGLPPTLSEIDNFLADASPDAYERVVDRLLASPRFGERMAVAWLDAARYGDTSVFHGDGPRDMWAWRDWVINAYNENKPFDQFTVEQLAGDLIPNATVEQKIGSAFNRNNATTDEGGAIPEEFRVEYAVDRVKTTSIVWLGLTMECAQCHDHKYDPIAQEDYYRFFAYFNQAADPGMQTRKGNTAPTVDVPNYQTQAELAATRQELRRIEADLAARRSETESEFLQWTNVAIESGLEDRTPQDMLLHFALDEGAGATLRDQVDPSRRATVHGVANWTVGKLAGALQCDAQTYADLGNVADFERDDQFSYSCWIRPAGSSDGAPLARMNDQKQYRGFDLYVHGDRVAVHLVHQWPENAIKVITKNKLAKDQWQHVVVTYDGSSKAAGINIYVDGQPWKWDADRDNLSATIRTEVPLYIGRRNPGAPFNGAIDDVRIYERALSATEAKAFSRQASIQGILAKDAAERNEKDTESLRTYYLSEHDSLYGRIDAEHQAIKSRERELAKARGTVMVMGDVDKPRMTYVLGRGNYASPQENRPVEPGVPTALPPLADDAPPNRLGLAQWLVDPNHPLTARIAVNRYWMMLFGTGLVETAEDFGAQGAWPSHPDLLDWLAVDFVESGWDIKRMIRQIVLSAAYRQSSRVSHSLYEDDPGNRLVGRGPRFRLQGEFIRDMALAASGLLVGEIGGPSVKPYQPDGLWNEVSINTSLRFQQDHGDNLYRRSMYIYWKRSAPPPSMAIFDAPSRETCTIRRSRTNTPLQALVTLNDPQFVEAARALAQRVIASGGSTVEEKISKAYRLAAGVRPSPAALRVLLQTYRTELAVFRAVPDRAEELLEVGESSRDRSIDAPEHAAMTIITSMILNLDETLTRG